MLLAFGSRTQAILTARERGQRVITFVENRIRNAGLGLQELKKVSDVQKVMNPLITSTKKPLYNSCKIDSITGLRLPVAISYSNKWPKIYTSKTNNDITTSNPYKVENIGERKNVWHGNILTLLYAQREDDNTINLVICPTDSNIQSVDISTDEAVEFNFIDDNKSYEHTKRFYHSASKNRINNINNWTVLVGTGIPLSIVSENNSKVKLKRPSTYTAKVPVVHTGDEMLYLKCVRMFVNKSDDGNMNFVFQTLDSQASDNSDWSDLYPHEQDILGMYMEMDKDNNILDLWVLATGGKDDIKHDRPADWPEKAQPDKNQWANNCQYEITYVSHASWKLHNIPKDFNWTN